VIAEGQHINKKKVTKKKKKKPEKSTKTRTESKQAMMINEYI